VDAIIFQSGDSNFCVFKITGARSGGIAVVMRGMPPLLGEEISLEGQWVEHARFGRQFQAVSFKSAAGLSVRGMERFLGSGAIKGVGRTMAARIVACFGPDTLRVLSEEPSRLTAVSGIGTKKAEAIGASYGELAEIRGLMLFLEENGISANYAPKLQKVYGGAAIELLKSNPYRLAHEVEGIGFKIADRIAVSLGIAYNDRRRISGGIEFALRQVAQAGHVCVPEEMLRERAAALLALDGADVEETLKDLLKNGALRTENFGGEFLVYPEYLYRAEVETAQRLLYLKSRARSVRLPDADSVIREWEGQSGIKLAKVQREAIDNVLRHGVLVLTGGPGTGKTTIIRGIIAVLEAAGCRIQLAAPTGRAARRLAASAGRPALTVHKLLEYAPHEGPFAFGRNESAPLDADALIVDESSMLDIALAAFLLKATPPGCRLIFAGDVDQLPAVGPGSVLKDIIRSQKVPVLRLNEVFRQGRESRIVLNAHLINRGRMPDFTAPEEFSLAECADEDAVAAKIVEEYVKLAEAHGGQNIQVLSPMHKQACGVENLNRLLQETLNPPGGERREIATPRQALREGDKIMQMRNNYDKEVFNGDIGWVESIEGRTLTARFPDIGGGLAVRYEQGELDELQLAYAMSVHKSQGGEYPIVILALSRAHYLFLQRNLLYTAVTRARRQVLIAGQKKSLQTAVLNDRMRRRYSLLTERLRETPLC
jgi:exodeoxyribonuclease V alpha subunit